MMSRGNSWRAGGLIPTLVGLLLISAAAMKVANPRPGDSPPTPSGWMLVALIELELVVGLWLLSRRSVRAVRIAAITLFSAFAIFNWTQVAAGAVSCACFGPILVRPWVTLTLDLLVVLMLLLWRPQPVQLKPTAWRPHEGRSALSSRWLRLSLLGLLVGLPGGWAWRNARADFSALIVDPSPLDLGSIPQGGAARASFELRNPGIAPLWLTDVQSSCPCMIVLLPDPVIVGGGAVAGELQVNMFNEPAFSGNLAVEVRGYTATHELAFRLMAQARIVR
jgi:Protein of unknown function (DUF1573)